MDYFKFTCPHCHTRIGTTPDTAGQHVNCPNCHGEVIIPPPPANEGDVPAGIPAEAAQPATEAEAEHTVMLKKTDLDQKPATQARTGNVDHFDGPVVPSLARLEEDNPFASAEPTPELKATPAPAPAAEQPKPAQPAEKKIEPAATIAPTTKDDEKKTTATPAAASPPATGSAKPEESKNPVPAPDPELESSEPEKAEKQELLIGNLTPEIKIDLLKQARTHIDSESKWIPGRNDAGRTILAARQDGENVIPEKPGSAAATHYSIVGALLAAMDLVNVKSTASGRSEMLHGEMEEAARIVSGKLEPEKVDPMDLPYDKCLAVFDTMMTSYNKQSNIAAGRASDSTESESAGIDELLKQDEKDLTIAEVLEALNYKLVDHEKRIEGLERKVS